MPKTLREKRIAGQILDSTDFSKFKVNFLVICGAGFISAVFHRAQKITAWQ
ncbi:MAG: hypothetical protein V3T17_01250 [Pseudomonadales bacterium]